MSLVPNSTKLAVLPLVVICILAAGETRAETYTEIEPNNTFATANFFPSSDGTLRITGATMSDMPGFSDYFRFLASAGTSVQLTATVTNSNPMLDVPTIRLQLLSPSGATLAEDEETGRAATSVINFSVTQDGLYGALIRPALGCQCAFGYRLDITGVAPGSTPVPEPVTLLMLGTGLVGVAARARRRAR